MQNSYQDINNDEKSSQMKHHSYRSPQFTLMWIIWEIKKSMKVQQDSKYETSWKLIKLNYMEAFGFSFCKFVDEEESIWIIAIYMTTVLFFPSSLPNYWTSLTPAKNFSRSKKPLSDYMEKHFGCVHILGRPLMLSSQFSDRKI